MNDLNVADRNEILLNEEYILYYVSSDNGRVLSLNINKDEWGEPQSIANVDKMITADKRQRLTVYPSDSDSEDTEFDLYLRPLYMTDDEDRGMLVRASITNKLPIERSYRGAAPFAFDGKRFGKVASWDADLEWEFETGFWAISGITATNNETKENVRFAQETPFISWSVTYAIQLEGDLVIFQLGDDQICILQAETRKIALVTRGTSPIVTRARRNK